MKNDLVKKLVPHVVAILLFLLVSVLFCRPALQGNVLNQHDVAGWRGVANNAFEYKDTAGHFPLWNTNVFSGMPNYMIALDGKSILPNLQNVFGLGLPQPISFFFIACLCFYILCLSLRVKQVVAVFGAFVYAFATYNPVIISAGHLTKMYSIGFAPLMLAGFILAFEKKYWLGLAVATLGVYMLIASNHPQISYYSFIVLGGIGISYLVNWIRNKEWKHMQMAIGVSIVAVVVGLMANSLSFLITREYSKATIRGGKSISIEGDSVTTTKTSGLDTSYAFQYSMKVAEPLVMMMPEAFGGGSANTLDENSNVVKKLVARGIQENQALQVAGSLPKYWGGLESTSGAPYSGVLICLLALFGFVLLKHPARWGLLAVSILSVMMTWGKFFPGFNVFLFENLPFYNKFRAPSMALVIAQIALPVVAVLSAHQLFFAKNSQEILKANFKKLLYTSGGLILFLALMWLMMDYSSPGDGMISDYVKRMGADDEIARLTIAGLKADRYAMFGGQLFRTLAFAVLLLLVIWLYLRNTLKPVVALAIIAVVAIGDLLIVGKKYLNDDNYVPKDEVQYENFTKSAIDQQILSDKEPHFRVYNAGPERFSASDYKVSTFHRSIGGYHPAKLRIYQDVIEKYLSAGANQQVLNMLNTKYIIAPNLQSGQPMLLPNQEGYGPAWLVKNIKFVKDEAAEIVAIGETNLKDTAVIAEAYANGLSQPQWDSAATVTLLKYDNDAIEYEVNASSPQFLVCSEVYYPYGWNAYIDGQQTNYVKTNYLLRGLQVPAGKHNIRFVFEPASYKKGVNISYIFSYVILLLVAGGFFMAWRESKKNKLKAV